MYVTAEMLQDAHKAIAEKRMEISKEQDSIIPKVGRTVRVVRGRKVPIGTTGVVVWFGNDKFRKAERSRYANHYFGPNPFGIYHADEHRIALMIDGQKVYLSAANVEVVPV